MRRPAATAATVIAALAVATGVLAHDFWIVPDAFRLAPGEQLQVRGQTSSRFPTSESAVALDRVASARIFGESGDHEVGHLMLAGTSLMLHERMPTEGQFVVAVTLHSRSVRESADGFRRYLVLEGAPEAAERYERLGLLPRDSVTRRYAKYAKTIVEVGEGGGRAFSRIAGHPLEFIPLVDPASLAPGDTLAVRLLFAGRPLPGIKVHADGVLRRGTDFEAAAATATHSETVTDDAGIARVVLSRAGLWNVRTLHIVPAAAGSGADWDTHWATLVIGVGAWEDPRSP